MKVCQNQDSLTIDFFLGKHRYSLFFFREIRVFRVIRA